jgi:hypothetical protein
MPGTTSRRWLGTSSSAGSRMPSRRPPERGGFGERRRSWRKDSAGPAVGRGASTATAKASSAARANRISDKPRCRRLPPPALAPRSGCQTDVRSGRSLRPPNLANAPVRLLVPNSASGNESLAYDRAASVVPVENGLAGLDASLGALEQNRHRTVRLDGSRRRPESSDNREGAASAVQGGVSPSSVAFVLERRTPRRTGTAL